MTVRVDDYDAVVAKINAKYANSLRRGNEQVKVKSISTGSPELDVAMGRGVPMGRWTRFYGGYGCLAPETKVLTDAYQWIDVGLLAENDGVVGFDEYSPVIRQGIQRKLRVADVTGNPWVVLPSYRIITDRSETIASNTHLWLVRRGDRSMWVSSFDLDIGDRILWFGEPWRDLSSGEREMAAYLGGLFDGEGSIDGNRVTFYQNPGPVLERGIDYMQKLGFCLVSAKAKSEDKICVNARFCGTATELMRFLAFIPSVRLCARAQWEGREILPKGPHVIPGSNYATVVAKEFVGDQELCGISTSTKTLISDGLYSHNSTKTMTAYAVIACAQRMGIRCALYNIEKRYEAEFAARRGINTKDLTLVEGTTIEEIGDKMEALLGVVHLHVLDSCTMAVSEDELAADIRDWRPGISARAWGKVFRRLNERFDPVDNTAILIDQMRTTGMGGKGPQEDPAGGRVFDHQSSMSVLFRASSWMWRNNDGVLIVPDKAHPAKKESGIDDQVVPHGREIKLRVEKSSVCRPFRTATLHYDLDTLEYDRTYEYVKAAKHYGVVESHGAWYWWVPKRGETVKLNGEKQLREFIEKNKIFRQLVHSRALEAA